MKCERLISEEDNDYQSFIEKYNVNDIVLQKHIIMKSSPLMILEISEKKGKFSQLLLLFLIR